MHADVCHQNLMDVSFFDTLPLRRAPCEAARDFVPIEIWTGGVAERLRGDAAVFAAMFANTVTILMSGGEVCRCICLTQANYSEQTTFKYWYYS